MQKRGAPGTETPADRSSDRAASARTVDHWIRPFLEDSALWPVLIVAILSFSTFGAAILVVAVDTRSRFAIAGLLILGWMSTVAIWGDLRVRRLGPTGGIVVVLWLLSASLALAASSLGFV